MNSILLNKEKQVALFDSITSSNGCYDGNSIRECYVLSLYISEYILSTCRTKETALKAVLSLNTNRTDERFPFYLFSEGGDCLLCMQKLYHAGLIDVKETSLGEISFCISNLFSDILYNESENDGLAFISFVGKTKAKQNINTYNKEEFDKCWDEYNKKGCKKKSIDVWKKLSTCDIEKIKVHIPFYVSSVKERVYQKDFERYLSYRIFEQPVFKDNVEIYNPEDIEKREDGVYSPRGNKFITFNKTLNCYCTVDDIRTLFDGYSKDDRPDGAVVYKNGIYFVWCSKEKEWKEKSK